MSVHPPEIPGGPQVEPGAPIRCSTAAPSPTQPGVGASRKYRGPSDRAGERRHQSVLELCEKRGIPAGVVPIPREALENADEVFAATTAGSVMPVSRVGARVLGNDRPDPLSLQLNALYRQRHREGWHSTPVPAL